MLCIRRPAGVPLSRWGCREFEAERVRDPRPRRRTHSKATRHALGCVRRARGGGVPEHCLVSPECRAPRRFKAHQASGTAGRARSAWQRGARRRPLAAGDGEAGERGVLRNPGPSVRRLRTAVEGLLFDSLKGQVERVAQRMVVLERVSSQLSSRVLTGRGRASRVRGPRRRGRPAPRASRQSGRVTRAWSRLGLLRRGHRRRAAAHANLGRCP